MPTMVDNLFQMQVPEISAIDNIGKIRIIYLDTTNNPSSSVFNMIDPDGVITNLVSTLKLRPFPGWSVGLYDTSVTFTKLGIYTFAMEVIDIITGTNIQVMFLSTHVTQWASNMDDKISAISKQRVDIQRVLSQTAQRR